MNSTKSASELVYDLLSRRPSPGEVFTYSELSEAMGRDSRSNRSAIYIASKRLGKSHERRLVCVTGHGYRIAEAHEHSVVAKSKAVIAKRRLGDAKSMLDHTRIGELNPEQKREHETTMGAIVAMRRDIARHERLIQGLSDDVDAIKRNSLSESHVAFIERLMERERQANSE